MLGKATPHLLDSHVLVWFLNGDKRLSRRSRVLLENSEADIFVSAAAGWEISTKVRLGKWPEAAPLSMDLEAILGRMSIATLPITMEHAQRAGMLPGPHRDPFDRMIAAQALHEGFVLATADPVFASFGVPVLW